MSQSFYNHLAQLLENYFSNHTICKGDKYRFIIENDEGRNMFKEALKTLEFENIIIRGIFSISELEEDYHTFYVKFPDQPRLIVGDIDSATINYLDTMRNAVSNDKPYADDAILYILKNDISSSIKSASRRLDDPGMPFDIKEIASALKSFIEINIQNNKEKAYLLDYISTKSNEIESRRFTLFDLGSIIDIVYERTFKNNSFVLGYFRDEKLDQGQYSPDHDALIERVKHNRDLYEDVEHIMKEGDKEKGLEKLFHESMVALILSHEHDWFSFFDYDTINAGRLTRRDANNKFVSCQVLIPSHDEDYNINPRDKKSNKKQQVIVFDDRHAVSETCVQLSFEKPLPNTKYPQNCIKSRENLKISLDKFFKINIDPDNSNYKFNILRLPIPKADFTELAPYFSINNHGDIIIDLPSNVSSVRLGTGTNELTVPDNGNVVWSPGCFIIISAGQDEANEFNIDFNGSVIKFIIRGGSQATVPREPLYLIQDVYNYRDSYRRVNDNGGDYFSLLRLQEHQFSIKSVWFRQLLKGERFMCNNHATTLSVTINVEQEFLYDVININIPQNVRDAYNNLCDYFSHNKLVPSLAYVTKELRHLYEQYIIAINAELSTISDYSTLDERHKAICRLGVVEDEENNRVFLSPLHPMLVAYQLDFSRSYDVVECPANVMALASPLFLMPYISYNDIDYRPYIDNLNDGIRSWLFFERRNRQQQIRIDNLTTKVVLDKIIQFTTNCSYLFPDIDTPLKINAIGIDDDENIVIAIIRYIKDCLNRNSPVQKIEVHLYVDDLLKENFHQKLYRLNHYDLIINEINELNENLGDSYNYTEKDIIRVLLSRVLFFTHPINSSDENNTTVYYSHLTFYRMLNKESEEQLHEVYMMNLPSEIGYNGLISQYSTLHNKNTYTMGFGIKGIEEKVESFEDGYIFRMAYLMNELYYNSRMSDLKPYHKKVCLGNIYVFNAGQLLQRLYDNSCWVTFISPEVDIDFFYRSGLYIIHFTDQLTLNSKYDSITVTNRIKQYNNLLQNACSKFAENQLQPDEMSKFQRQMLHYFNVLNGRWLLELNQKTTLQVREKVSVVASCMVIREFLQKIPDTIWIPISIEEIVRVTKNIGLKEDHLFSKKELGIKGPMSDDLLIMGLNYQDPDNLKLYFYPVEVKVTDSNAVAAHGKVQITKTYQAFRQNIFGEVNFVKCVYRTFFTNIMLLTADKMKAYNLISEDEYNKLQEYRIQLLNLNYVVQDRMPLVEFGHCGLMVFHQELPMLRTIPDEEFELAISELSLPFEYALNIISGNNSQVVQTAERQEFSIDETAKRYMESIDVDDTSASVTSQSDAVTDSTASVLPAPTNTSDIPVQKPVIKPVSSSELASVPTSSPSPDTKSVSTTDAETDPISGGAEKYDMRILIGKTLSNNRDVYYEPNNTNKLLNLNLGITGTSGSGKTQNLSAIIYQLSKFRSENVGNHPIGMLIFDYKGDYNSDDFCKNVGGTCTFSNFPFNPLHLIYSERDKQIKNIPAITAERVSDALAKSYDSGTVQQARIKQVIIETYEDFGITSNPDTWSLTSPTMNDVVNNYFDKYDTTDTVYALFSNLRDWRIFESDPKKCVSIFNWLTCPRVIDLTSFSDEIKRAVVSLILEIFNNEMHLLGPSRYVEDKREIRAFVVVDEAHQFLSKEYDALDKILREGRSFGVGMILATQNINDFKTKKNNYSTNIASWILHHQVNVTKQELYSIFGNTDPNLNQYSAFLTKSGYNAITKFGKIVNANSCVQYRKIINI